MRRTVLVVSIVASLLFMGMLAPDDTSTGSADSQIGLSKTSVFDVPAPDVEKKNESEPGDRPLLERSSAVAAPLIPHGVAEFLPITLTDNQCADCHEVDEEKEAGEPTPAPRSHYIDLRNTPDDVLDTIVGARYNCMSCHVSPGDNEPLTANTFGH